MQFCFSCLMGVSMAIYIPILSCYIEQDCSTFLLDTSFVKLHRGHWRACVASICYNSEFTQEANPYMTVRIIPSWQYPLRAKIFRIKSNFEEVLSFNDPLLEWQNISPRVEVAQDWDSADNREVRIAFNFLPTYPEYQAPENFEIDIVECQVYFQRVPRSLLSATS